MASPTPRTTPTSPVRQSASRAGTTYVERGRRAGHLGVSASAFLATQTAAPDLLGFALPAPAVESPRYNPGTASAAPAAQRAEFPAVWLIALATPAGGVRSIEGAGRTGVVKVSRPYGHLRALRPVMPEPIADAAPAASAEPDWVKAWTEAAAQASGRAEGMRQHESFAQAQSHLPAQRLTPQVVSAVEVETDAGIFRVERPDDVLTHQDLAWAIANLEPGEPDSVVPLPRRQLAMLLTLLPAPENAERPEQDPMWGWAHRLRGPWERGPIHPAGKLGRLISVDPDPSGRGMHRACFEIVGTDEIVWAAGVPCFRTGSVYELVPLTRRGSISRWLTWPLAKGRRRAGTPELPKWEIARAVYRVGTPRWPLAGVIEPLGPLGVAG
jgi:hypothetical protein